MAKEVCAILGLGNSRSSLSLLDEDEKNTVHIMDGNRGNPVKTVINEPGLYSLIFRSRKPEAKQFKRWITHIVIPEIRRTGGFLYATKDMTDGGDHDFGLQCQQRDPLPLTFEITCHSKPNL